MRDELLLRPIPPEPPLYDIQCQRGGLVVRVEPPPAKFIEHRGGRRMFNFIERAGIAELPVVENRAERVYVGMLFNEICRFPRTRGIEELHVGDDFILD